MSTLILGGGSIGLATAYALVQAGYHNVTVVDESAAVPPAASAGNDLNKLVRAEYEDPFYAKHALTAMAAWNNDPLFRSHFRPCGVIWANSQRAAPDADARLQRGLATIAHDETVQGRITPLTTRADFAAVAPALDGLLPWRGYLNRTAGYARAADVLRALHAACVDGGVAMVTDRATELLYKGDRCTGAAFQSGHRLAADTVVLALGAGVVPLLPQLGTQITAKAWPIAHIQLSPSEAAALAALPVTCAWDLGFFTAPDPATGLMKMCPASAGYTNRDASGLSAPVASDCLPAREANQLRRLLRDTLPALADRPFVQTKMCWCADTADGDFVLDVVPGVSSLVVATGDSGHAFKMLPLVGNWVRSVLETGRQDEPRWRWKETAAATGEAGWRVGETQDLAKL